MFKFPAPMIGICLSLLLMPTGCDRTNGSEISPVYEGRRGDWLNDGTVGIKVIDIYETLVAHSPSLGITYYVGNLGTSPVSFDKVSAVYYMSDIKDVSTLFKVVSTMTVVTDEGIKVYFDKFDTPKVTDSNIRPLVIPPSEALEFDGRGPVVQLVASNGDARRDYKIELTVYSGDVAIHGPFIIKVTARRGSARETIFE